MELVTYTVKTKTTEWLVMWQPYLDTGKMALLIKPINQINLSWCKYGFPKDFDYKKHAQGAIDCLEKEIYANN